MSDAFGPKFGDRQPHVLRTASFTRVDAAVYYSITPSLRLQANIENLLDEEYYASAHSNTNIMPGTPRALRVGIDWRF